MSDDELNTLDSVFKMFFPSMPESVPTTALAPWQVAEVGDAGWELYTRPDGTTTLVREARYLYEFMGVKKDYTSWAKQQVDHVLGVEKYDWFVQPGMVSRGAFTIRANKYYFTLELEQDILLMATTREGKAARNRMRAELVAAKRQCEIWRVKYLAEVEKNLQIAQECEARYREMYELAERALDAQAEQARR
jgi:phage anti-repressor protein